MTIDLINVDYLQDAVVSRWRIQHKKGPVTLEATVEIKKPHDKTLQSHRASALAEFFDMTMDLGEKLGKHLTN